MDIDNKAQMIGMADGEPGAITCYVHIAGFCEKYSISSHFIEILNWLESNKYTGKQIWDFFKKDHDHNVHSAMGEILGRMGKEGHGFADNLLKRMLNEISD